MAIWMSSWRQRLPSRAYAINVFASVVTYGKKACDFLKVPAMVPFVLGLVDRYLRAFTWFIFLQ
jgi:hypothetical protein